MGSCFAGNDAKHSSKQWAAPHAGGFELVMDVRDVHGTANMQCFGANSRCLEPATAGPFLAVPSRIPGCPAEARCNVAVTCLACCGVRALLPCADATEPNVVESVSCFPGRAMTCRRISECGSELTHSTCMKQPELVRSVFLRWQLNCLPAICQTLPPHEIRTWTFSA